MSDMTARWIVARGLWSAAYVVGGACLYLVCTRALRRERKWVVQRQALERERLPGWKRVASEIALYVPAVILALAFLFPGTNNMVRLMAGVGEGETVGLE